MEEYLRLERELATVRERQSAFEASSEEQHKSIFRQLAQQDRLIESVNKIATSNQLLAEEQKRQGDRLDVLCSDVKDLKEKPVKRIDSIIEKVLLAIAGAVVSYVLAKLGIF